MKFYSVFINIVEMFIIMQVLPFDLLHYPTASAFSSPPMLFFPPPLLLPCSSLAPPLLFLSFSCPSEMRFVTNDQPHGTDQWFYVWYHYFFEGFNSWEP